jgi:hypothetical protein
MADSKTPMQKQREQRRAHGWRDVNIWLTPEGQQRITRLTEPGESLSTLIDRALAALDTIHSRPLNPHTSEWTSEPSEDLQALIAREVSRYFTSDRFRDNLFIPLFKQALSSALPSDLTKFLSSDLTRSLPRESITITALPVLASPSKAELVTWLHTLQGSGMSLQHMADELNARGIPTLSGTGHWQKGTIGKLLAQRHERS